MTLLGHLVSFAFDIVCLVMVSIPSTIESPTARLLLPNIAFCNTYGIQGLFQIVLSKTLQVELANALASAFFVPTFTRLFALFNFLGMFQSFYACLISLRTRYL